MTGSLLVYYLIQRWKQLGKLDGKQFTAKTIVTSMLIKKISESQNVQCYDVLTGFKYIAELILNLEGKEQFIGGGEESYGYLAGDLVRDKDAVLSCVLIAEMCAWAKSNGKSLYDVLIDIHSEYGFYLESLISITKKGKTGAEDIAKMMEDLRSTPPKNLAGSSVLTLRDFKLGKVTNLADGSKTETGLPSSNVLQFETADGTVVTARPSGTEPKIKFYFSVNGALKNKADYDSVEAKLAVKIKTLQSDLGLN
jgi:phosphoglucomutase